MSRVRADRVEGAAGVCRRLLALVLAAALLIGAWQPVAAAAPDPGIGAAMTIGADLDGPHSPEKASGQHCAHCACHAPAHIEPASAMPAPPVRLIRLRAGETAGPGLNIPPPSRPPRI